MNITPFTINHLIALEGEQEAEIRPCCNEDNVVDYAVWRNNQLAFTITYNIIKQRWIVALKNADEYVDDTMVQQIGAEIENRYKNE